LGREQECRKQEAGTKKGSWELKSRGGHAKNKNNTKIKNEKDKQSRRQNLRNIFKGLQKTGNAIQKRGSARRQAALTTDLQKKLIKKKGRKNTDKNLTEKKKSGKRRLTRKIKREGEGFKVGTTRGGTEVLGGK